MITSLGDIVEQHAETFPDKPAIIQEGVTWTYRDLRELSRRAAQGLLEAGVGEQERVAFLDRSSREYFPFLFGAGMVNAVTVAVNWRLAAPEMEYILNNAGAKVLLIGEEFLGHLAEMDLPSTTTVIVLGDPGDTGYPTWEDWVNSFEPEFPGIEVAPEDTCYQLYTSGTTGLPKGVEISNRNLFGMLPNSGGEWSFDSDSVNLVSMPLFHIAGSGWGVCAFFFGGTNVILRDVDPAEILRLLDTERITNILLVPAVLQFIQAVPGAENTDFSSVRSVVYGASPISEETLVGAMNLMGCDFVQTYGLTETTGGVTTLPASDHDPGGPNAHLLRSAGKAWGDVEIRIVDDETMTDLPDGEVGEIWIRSRQNLEGYWANPEATALVFPEGRDENGIGWFRSGDAGYLRDGYLYIHDRVKDMIISGGENIYPAEVENALMSHPDLDDVAVIGVPSEKWGETVKAIVVVRAGSDPSEAEIINYCRSRIAHYKCPTSVDRIDVLPRNPSGKILKTELRVPYWGDKTRAVN